MNMKHAVFLLALLSGTAQAEVYKSVNERGEVVYSDVPSQGAERVQVPAIPTYTPAPVPAAPPAPAAAQPAASDAYETLAMQRPHGDETIRSNAGIVNVAVTLEPGLQIKIGHRVQFYLDDQPRGRPLARLSTSFTNVDRGTHSVSATVIDGDGNVLIKSTPVSFHLLRASLQQPANPLNKPAEGDAGGSSSGNTGTGGNATSSGGSASGGTSGSSSSSSGSSGGTGVVRHPKGF